MRQLCKTIASGVLAWLVACRFELPPESQTTDGPGNDSTFPSPEICNYKDDDGDGLVDEGFEYTQAAGSLTTVVEGTYVGVWWIGKGPTSLVLTWAPGDGTASDVLRLQALDLQGIPIAVPAVTTSNQPSNYHEPVWMGNRFVAGHTKRQYACGGESSTSCPTELRAFAVDGTALFAAAQVVVDTPLVQSGPIVNGEYTLLFSPPSVPGNVRIRSYDPGGNAGSLNRALFSIDAYVYAIAGYAVGTEIFWVYSKNESELILRVTDLSGDTLRGPLTLSTQGRFTDYRGGRQILVHEGVVYALFRDTIAPDVYVGRWDVNGVSVGAPTKLTSADRAFAMDRDGDQLYVLTKGGVEPDPIQLARVALNGTVLQYPAPVRLPDSENSAALAAVPTGVVVAAANYTSQLSWARYGCP